MHQTSSRRLIRLPYNINQPAFSDAIADGVIALTAPKRIRAGAS